MKDLTSEEITLIYLALRQNDGTTLCPRWSVERQRKLTAALDKLRLELYCNCDPFDIYPDLAGSANRGTK